MPLTPDFFPGRLRRYDPIPAPVAPPGERTLCKCGETVLEPALWVVHGKDFCSLYCARQAAGNL